MKIVEYNNKYDEPIKDLLVELQKYLMDIDDWNTQILKTNYREEYFKIDMELVKKQNGKIYLAQEDKDIVGLVVGIINKVDEVDRLTNDCKKTGNVIELIVSKNARGKGIGNQLLEKMEKYFISINCERISIEVFEPNKKALNFYQKNGYIIRDIFVSKDIKQEQSINTIHTKNYIDKTITAKIDRQLGSKHPKYGFLYPVNYGYIPNTISEDGEELDCYVLGIFEPIETFTGKCIAVIHRLNDNDDKLILTSEGKDYSDDAIRALTEFQERFFKSIIIRKP